MWSSACLAELFTRTFVVQFGSKLLSCWRRTRSCVVNKKYWFVQFGNKFCSLSPCLFVWLEVTPCCSLCIKIFSAVIFEFIPWRFRNVGKSDTKLMRSTSSFQVHFRLDQDHEFLTLGGDGLHTSFWPKLASIFIWWQDHCKLFTHSTELCLGTYLSMGWGGAVLYYICPEWVDHFLFQTTKCCCVDETENTTSIHGLPVLVGWSLKSRLPLAWNTGSFGFTFHAHRQYTWVGTQSGLVHPCVPFNFWNFEVGSVFPHWLTGDCGPCRELFTA